MDSKKSKNLSEHFASSGTFSKERSDPVVALIKYNNPENYQCLRSLIKNGLFADVFYNALLGNDLKHLLNIADGARYMDDHAMLDAYFSEAIVNILHHEVNRSSGVSNQEFLRMTDNIVRVLQNGRIFVEALCYKADVQMGMQTKNLFIGKGEDSLFEEYGALHRFIPENDRDASRARNGASKKRMIARNEQAREIRIEALKFAAAVGVKVPALQGTHELKNLILSDFICSIK